VNYRVKLDDGSEIGPLDLETLRTWYREGLIGPTTPAQRMGASRWSTLDRVVDLKRWGSTSASRKRVQGRQEAEAELEGPGETPRWRMLLASAVLFVLGLAAGAAALLPERLPVDLDGAPWTQIALGVVLPALLLLRGWELGRKLARLLLFLASLALLAAAGALFARQAGQQTWFVLGSAWLVSFGLVAFLARGRLHWFHAALWLLVVVSGLVGLGRFGYIPESAFQAQVREWAAPEPSWVSEVSGWKVDLPPGWVRLRDGNPVSPAVDAAATFAAPRLGAVAVLWEAPASDEAALDRELDALIEQRRQAVPSLELTDRSDARLAGLAVRRGSGRWERGPEAWVEHDSVWRDGWLRYSFAVWAPEGGAAERAIAALEPRPGPAGTLEERLGKAAAALSAQQPLLSELAARVALRRSRRLDLDPDAALLQVLSAAASSRSALTAADAARLEAIEGQLERSTVRRQRGALRAALDGRGDAGSVELLRQAADALDPEERLHLRELWGRAAAAQP
jgi:hypothetical protein